MESEPFSDYEWCWDRRSLELGATCQADWEVRGTEDVDKLRKPVGRFGRVRRMDGRKTERDTLPLRVPWFPPHLGDPPGGLTQISTLDPSAGPPVPVHRKASSHLLGWTLSTLRAEMVSLSPFIP